MHPQRATSLRRPSAPATIAGLAILAALGGSACTATDQPDDVGAASKRLQTGRAGETVSVGTDRSGADKLCRGQPRRTTSWDSTVGVPRSQLEDSFSSYDELFDDAPRPLEHTITYEDDSNLDALVSDSAGKPVAVLGFMNGPVKWHLITVVYC